MLHDVETGYGQSCKEHMVLTAPVATSIMFDGHQRSTTTLTAAALSHPVSAGTKVFHFTPPKLRTTS